MMPGTAPAGVSTMLLTILVTSAAMAVAVLVVAWRRAEREGLLWWGAGTLLNTGAFALFGLAYAERWPWPLVAGNVLQAAALAAVLRALTLFGARALGGALLWGPVATVAALAGVFAHQASWRVPTVELIFALQAGAAAWCAVAPAHAHRDGIERGRLLAAAGMALLSLVYVRRVACALARSGAHDDAGALQYLAGLVGIVFGTLGYVVMHAERAEAAYRRLALEDELTGIANRRGVLAALERAVAQASREQAPVAVLMVDIDFFKRVNDVHGHPVGDLVLREVARRMRRDLRAQDLLGRYGGEEFLAVLPRTDAQGALVVAEHLRRAFEREPLPCEGRSIAITVSVGVHGRVPARDASLAHASLAYAMVDAADRALYRAKADGRNRSCVAD